MGAMHTEYAWPEVRLALKASQCSFEGCRHMVATVIESQAYCARPIYERLAELKPVPPLLSIYGSLDSKMSAENAKLYERVPGATVVTLEGVGHSPHVEAPAKTVKLIEDFLSSGASDRGPRVHGDAYGGTRR